MKKYILIFAGMLVTLVLALTSCTGSSEKPNLQAPATETVAPAAAQDTTANKETGKAEENKKDDDDDDDDEKKK